MMRSLESQYDSLRQEDVRSKASTDPMYKYYKRMLPKPRLIGDIESRVVLHFKFTEKLTTLEKHNVQNSRKITEIPSREAQLTRPRTEAWL